MQKLPDRRLSTFVRACWADRSDRRIHLRDNGAGETWRPAGIHPQSWFVARERDEFHIQRRRTGRSVFARSQHRASRPQVREHSARRPRPSQTLRFRLRTLCRRPGITPPVNFSSVCLFVFANLLMYSICIRLSAKLPLETQVHK